MQTFDLSSLVAESERGDQRWREFLRVPSLSWNENGWLQAVARR